MAEAAVHQALYSSEGAGDSMDSLENEKSMNGDDSILNNIHQNKQNGFAEESEAGEGSSSRSPDRRDKEREHKHSSKSDKHKQSSHSSSDKHKSSSSSSSKHPSSSSSSKHRDGHSSSSSHKHGSSSSSKNKEGHSSSSRDKHSSSHSSSKDKHKSSSDKHHSSSSSSDKHKHSSSSSSKHSSGDKHKDKEREKDKSKHSSSSSRKENETEEERRVRKEKERQERKEKERQERKEKERQERKERAQESQESEAEIQVKRESVSPVKQEKRSPVKPKQEPESDDDDEDVPLSVRLKQEKVDTKPVKREREESDDEDEDVPLAARVAKVKKVKKEKVAPTSGKKRKASTYDEDSEDEKPLKKKKTPSKPSPTKGTATTPKGRKGKKEEEEEVWKWWEEKKVDDGSKWQFLEHKGPLFAPAYEPLPDDVHFYYDGKVMKLSEDAEETATFYSKMLEHDYTTKDVFNNNFFKEWRKMMTLKEKEKITDLKKCNFKDMCEYFKLESEKRKNRSKEEKLKLKEENAAIQEEYGFCIMDGHREKIGNFRIEPPGLFRGRGDHPKQGMLKRRVRPEDVIINCSKDAKVPEPPKGHKWKKVQHDNTVTWLASWNENIQGQIKYIMLNPSSRLKGEKDWQKYETARRLHQCVDKIRANYMEDWRSKEMRVRQRAVAMYFIDKLALRAGNEKEEGETADTVGCCSLRVEHLTLHSEKDGKQYVVEFDFLGKDSIRYQNAVPVEKRVYKNLQMFTDNKAPGDDLFDRLNTTILNKHLHDLVEGLTAKVFRTYNASRTLQEQLDIMTNAEDPIPAKMLSYNRANRAVAILCNHQRAAPKNFSKQMENMMAKIKDKRGQVKESKQQYKHAKAAFKSEKTQKNKMLYEKKKKAYERMEEQLTKLEVQATDKDENKEIALGTSKLNYLDPRISVAWCKKWEVPLEKVYNKTQREKFRWAIDMTDADFRF
ncbi:DNA topoisomerase I, mitochondrial-like [Mya arenaria]|uniref:DNA topoisomerase I, mitochondrial-like n=1 Tax=Mya arenaria TaxID=6604 RepID=UPI0022E96A76|nr:DNA topoisomerase I, mitochondrial-like [Mya arenaria]